MNRFEHNFLFILVTVVSDVFKEENDTINAHGFNDKKVTKEISNVAKSWYIKNCFTF